MAEEFDRDNFVQAIRVQVAERLETKLLTEVVPAMAERVGPGGGFFKDPSGETAASLRVVGVDLTNTRGWRFAIESSSPGAFFTNLGRILRPRPDNPRGVMTFRSKSTGKWVSLTSVDMTPYKDWIRRLTIEVLRGQ